MSDRPRLYLDHLVEAAEDELGQAAQHRRKRTEERVTRLRAERDALAGLLAARDALESHDYVPRAVAEWLSQGISAYVSGGYKSLDVALGLSKPGRASPLRKASEAHALRAALGMMFHLHLHGATIPDAAVLVASVRSDRSVDTLIDRYRRGGYSADVRRALESGHFGFDPEPTLALYPDEPLNVAQAKAAIRAMYAKRKA